MGRYPATREAHHTTCLVETLLTFESLFVSPDTFLMTFSSSASAIYLLAHTLLLATSGTSLQHLSFIRGVHTCLVLALGILLRLGC